MDKQYASVIEKALESYKSDEAAAFDAESLRSFCSYMLEQINNGGAHAQAF